jgi:hypothetical protein
LKLVSKNIAFYSMISWLTNVRDNKTENSVWFLFHTGRFGKGKNIGIQLIKSGNGG